MDSVESLSEDLARLSVKQKESKDLTEKAKLTIQISDIKKKRNAMMKQKDTKEAPVIVSVPTQDVIVTQEKQVQQEHPKREIATPGITYNEKAAGYLALAVKSAVRILSASVPYCEGAEKDIIVEELIPACTDVIEDLKSRDIDPKKIFNPYVVLGAVVAAPVIGRVAINYEKKTGHQLISLPSAISSTPTNQCSNGVVAQGLSGNVSSTGSSCSASSPSSSATVSKAVPS